MNKKNRLANRRGVGGLISLIGLVVVFAISSAAYLELNSSHSQLINNSIQINQKISDRNAEILNFTRTGSATHHNYDIENLGSETITLDSYIVTNGTGTLILGKQNIELRIISGGTQSISIDGSSDQNTDRIIFTTDLGKKCIISGNEESRRC